VLVNVVRFLPDCIIDWVSSYFDNKKEEMAMAEIIAAEGVRTPDF